MNYQEWYIQEHEVFGDGDRVICTYGPYRSKREAELERKCLIDESEDTWFTIHRYQPS